MANKYPLRTRMKTEEIHTRQLQIDVHSVTATGGAAVPVQLPQGAYVAEIHAWATALDQPVTIKVEPYVDPGQTLTSGSYKFLEIGSGTATTNITMEANTATAKGYVRVMVPSGDQYGAAAPLLSLFGSRYVLTTSATTGIINLAVVSVEI